MKGRKGEERKREGGDKEIDSVEIKFNVDKQNHKREAKVLLRQVITTL